MKRLCAVSLIVAVGAALNVIAGQAGAGVRPQDATSLALDRIYREYLELKRIPSVDGLVRLDRQLRDLMPGYTWEGWRLVSAAYLEPRYEELGVNRLLFDGDNLGYSGKLLAEAHALNPRSALRSHTLYSTIFSPDGETSNNVPSRDRAEAYVREFPSGPFVVEALTIVAHFYDDLSKVIKLEETGRRRCPVRRRPARYGPMQRRDRNHDRM